MAPSRKQVRDGARPEYMSFGAVMWSANGLDMWGRHVLRGPWRWLVWRPGPSAYEIPIILENRSIHTKYPYMPANNTAIKSKGFGIYSLGSIFFFLRFSILKSLSMHKLLPCDLLYVSVMGSVFCKSLVYDCDTNFGMAKKNSGGP